MGIHESPNDFPRNGEVSLTVETVVAELCANAVLHGRVPGRDFHLAMRLRVDGVLRIEVADARRERVPVLERRYDVEGERGRGLLLVEAMADRWGVAERQAVGKIVRCELDT
ncbi:ATP-binding protein [Streptomyces sp. WAC 06738]|uniref:ATP-binding protein n=1 Tax=Streptomyces sp. WAC 06738 TaxID=2203210 RepID=UPI001F0BA3EE|nr:ATP-binding protein [Streptomyces sp. WAC 06738]